MTSLHAVIADDLTGALDSGAAFAAPGVRVRVVLGTTHPPRAGTDVAVYCTESRALDSREAYARVSSLGTQLVNARVASVYKKIDSTMRGNVGAEIDALLDANVADIALLCPAYPGTGRTVVDGELLVAGVPLSRTPIALDPISPMRESRIALAVAAQSTRAIGRIDLATIGAGAPAIERRLDALTHDGCTVISADAISDTDLELLAAAVERSRLRVVCCGSAGFAGAIARYRLGGRSAHRYPRGSVRLPAVAVVGSAHPASVAQAARLAREPGWHLLPYERDAVYGRRAWSTMRGLQPSGERAEVGEVIVGVAIVPGGSFESGRASPGAARGHRLADASCLSAHLAELAQDVIEELGARTLLLTGGDTASAVLRRGGATGLDVCDEIEPGIVLSCAVGGTFAGFSIVTKAGGFGDAEALRRVFVHLGNEVDSQ